MFGKLEGVLVEDNMARDDDTITGEIHAAITLVVRRVAEKNASTRPGSEFVGHGGGGVRVAKATKDTQGRVIRVGVMEGKIWRGSANGFGGEAIKDVSGVMKRFYPKARR